MNTKRVSEKTGESWKKEKQKVLQLMFRQFNDKSNAMTTIDMPEKSTSNSQSSSTSSGSELDIEDLDQGQCLPSGWEKYLDLKTGAVYYANSEAGTRQISKSIKSRSSEGAVNLKLNLPTSKDLNKQHAKDGIIEEEAAVMRLVGCSKCLMYSMVPTQDPKCPKCKGSFLLHFSNEQSSSKRIHTVM